MDAVLADGTPLDPQNSFAVLPAGHAETYSHLDGNVPSGDQ